MAIVLITGASSGIGLASALAFARRGDRVYAGVRVQERGQQLESIAQQEGLDVRTVLLDVTVPESFSSVVSQIDGESGSIDVLVNNAGVLRNGSWEGISETDARLVMETNFFGPMLLARAVLPVMRRASSGCIIMISSLSGIAGLAGDVAYSASKFALEGATEALRHEVDRWGVRVALVLGGQYTTQLFDAVDSDGESQDAAADIYSELVAFKRAQNLEGLQSAFAPEDMAQLLLQVADADGSQLRWPADEVALNVLTTLHAQSDQERDAFLQMAGGTQWWSQGETPQDRD